MNSFRFCILILCLLFFHGSFAQRSSDCSNSLYEAGKEYEGGHFDKVISMLSSCIRNLAREEKFEAYRLIAICYLNLDKKDSAKLNAIRMLYHRPSYKNFPYVDPIEFTHLLEAISVSNKLDFGVFTGFNINSAFPTTNYSVTGSAAQYVPKAGFLLGVFGEYYLTKKISLTLSFLNQTLNYVRVADNVNGWNQRYSENLNYFSLPLSVKYLLVHPKKMSCSVSIGFQTSLLSTSYANIVMTNSDGDKNQNPTDRFTQRRKFVFDIPGGLHLKYKSGMGEAGLNIGYVYGINNIVNPKGRYNDQEFILSNQYIDSDIKFNTFFCTLSYQFPLLYRVQSKTNKQ